MVIKSYSKINLLLKVNSKYVNGLHEIQSLYCWINIFDKITINKIKKKKDIITFRGPFAKLVKSKDNTVFNLIKKLRELNLISNFYSIVITKNIPVFSGLGGGTSNAIFILKYLLKNKINNSLLNKIKTIAGSDSKLFFKKQGFLKNLRSVIDIKIKHKFYFVLIQPRAKCSTKAIYSNVRNLSKKEQFNESLINSRNKLIKYLSKSKNDLQEIVERKYPAIKKILTDIASEKGCYFSRMTGSGSVCYGLFEDKIVAKKAFNKLKRKYPKFWVSLAKTV